MIIIHLNLPIDRYKKVKYYVFIEMAILYGLALMNFDQKIDTLIIFVGMVWKRSPIMVLLKLPTDCSIKVKYSIFIEMTIFHGLTPMNFHQKFKKNIYPFLKL